MKKYFSTIAFFLLLITVSFTFASCKTKADEKINLTAYTDVPYENKAETEKYAKLIAKVIDSSYQELIGIKKIKILKGHESAIFIEFKTNAAQVTKDICIYFQITPKKYKDIGYSITLFTGEYGNVEPYPTEYELFIGDIDGDENKDLFVFYKEDDPTKSSLLDLYAYLSDKKKYALVSLNNYNITMNKLVKSQVAAIAKKNYSYRENDYFVDLN